VKFTSELRDATCQWDHTVLSATRQRWPPRLHPNRAGWYSIYRPRKDEKLSSPSWLVTYRDGLPVHRRSPIQVLTWSDVAQLRWSRATRYHYIVWNTYYILLELFIPLRLWCVEQWKQTLADGRFRLHQPGLPRRSAGSRSYWKWPSLLRWRGTTASGTMSRCPCPRCTAKPRHDCIQ